MSAGGEAHEKDLCLQRQRLHAAVRPAGQEARVLVHCATGEVSDLCLHLIADRTQQVKKRQTDSYTLRVVCLLWTIFMILAAVATLSVIV